MKTCTKCGLELTEDQFNKDRTGKDGLMARCKGCRRKYGQKNKVARSEYMKQWYGGNKLARAEYRLLYYQENKATINGQDKEYKKAHPLQYRMYTQKRNALKLQLPNSLTVTQWEEIKSHFGNRCCYCGEEKQLEQEHFIPVTSSGFYDINNIIPACRSCNASKSDNPFELWYPRYKHYSKKREKIILDFLNYKKNIQQLSISY